jgi:hypothetical protein
VDEVLLEFREMVFRNPHSLVVERFLNVKSNTITTRSTMMPTNHGVVFFSALADPALALREAVWGI